MTAIRSAVAFCAVLAAAAPASAAVTISKQPTRNMQCSAGVCSPTAAHAVLNAGELQTMLAAGDATVIAEATAQDLRVVEPLHWASARTLTLHSRRGLAIEKPIAVEGTAGLVLDSDEGGSDADLVFSGGGRVVFHDLASRLAVNGADYTLVGDIATLIGDVASDPAGHYALARNYDAGPDGTYTSAPIPTAFAGTFEGLGNTISNLTIATPGTSGEAVGLFALVQGTLRDIALKDAHVTGGDVGQGGGFGILAGTNVGIVVGANAVGGSLAARTASGAGGLVGTNFGVVSRSSASATVSSGNSGGLVAYNQNLILDSFATGAVVGHAFAGGLVGQNTGVVIRCQAAGSVTSTNKGANYIGGLAGWNESRNAAIAQSYATGAVVAPPGAAAGGLVGRSWRGATIVDSYALGAAGSPTKGRSVGGLVGTLSEAAEIARAYSTGAVSGGANASVGGSIGADTTERAKTNVYWDFETSGVSDPSRGAGNVRNDPGLAGLHDVEFRLGGLPAGFAADVWGKDPAINGGLPYLLANPPQ